MQDLDVTRLLRVERDGNPLRRFGHASPFIGKLGDLDVRAVHALARLARAALSPLPEPTLAIGMTESSLLLSWFVAWHQQPPVDLRFTTRTLRGGITGRTFREPHSHGPEHFLSLDEGRSYAQILVVEDELTTGATLANLIRAVRDIADRVFVLTLRDLRPPHMREALAAEMKSEGVHLEVLDLSTVPPLAALLGASLPLAAGMEEALEAAQDALRDGEGAGEPPPPGFNPFGRGLEVRVEALQALGAAWREHEPGALYVIGECVDVALEFWAGLGPRERPAVRQVTRSPWVVDGKAVCARALFEGDGETSRHFLYNWRPPRNGRALFVGEAATRCVGDQLAAFLRHNGVHARGIEVAAQAVVQVA